MTINIKTFLLCPVPDDQKPINEYLNLKENKFLNWGNLNTNKNKKFLAKLFLTFFSFFSIGQLQVLSFSSFFEILFNTLVIIQFFLLVILIRWITINEKFQNSRLVYEEASWYDGQIWEKPFFLIKNDKLISTQKIEPILEEIIKSFFLSLSFLFLVFQLK
jgi:hypothetical protein